MDDSFMLYDLKVEVVGSEKPMVCSHREGDYFLVIGENLVFPENNSFSMYALSALLPCFPQSSGCWIRMTGCSRTASSPVRTRTAGQDLRLPVSGNGNSATARVQWNLSTGKKMKRQKKEKTDYDREDRTYRRL